MARDTDETSSAADQAALRQRVAAGGAARAATTEPNRPGPATSSPGRHPAGIGLPLKLLILTSAFVMLAEVLIFVPSIANFRASWLMDRLTAAHLASLAAEAVPGGAVPEMLRAELLNTALVQSVAVKRKDQRRLVLPPDQDMKIDASFDLRPMWAGPLDMLWVRAGLIGDALGVFLAPKDRVIRVTGQPTNAGNASTSTLPYAASDFVEIVLTETPLRAAMIGFGLNILALSIIISIITAALVYIALSSLLVRPMLRLSRNMIRFSENPEDADRIIAPSARTDEIGIAERELAHMQRELTQLLQQKNRLAQLGLAVAKINHDLRNMLASAQLMSDRLAALPEPQVQRFSPKLIASLDRAISFCNDTLKFGRAEEAAPRRDLFDVRALVEEVGDGLALPREGLAWTMEIEPGLRIDADRDHLYRILNNLARNAIQALESGTRPGSALQYPLGEITIKAVRDGRRVYVELRDNGPGVPERARANLFQAFKGGARKGGSGLGLAIAAELVAAHGGRLSHEINGSTGAIFRFDVPDRGTGAA